MEYVADTVHVDGGSRVKGAARVEGNVVLVDSLIYGSAAVSGNVRVEASHVMGEAEVSGSAELLHSAVGGAGRVHGNAVLENIHVFDTSCVYGDAVLKSELGDGFIVELQGDCKFGGSATFKGLELIEDFMEKYGEDKVTWKKSRNKVRGEKGETIVLTDVEDMG